jgi:hypothetical protein
MAMVVIRPERARVPAAFTSETIFVFGTQVSKLRTCKPVNPIRWQQNWHRKQGPQAAGGSANNPE